MRLLRQATALSFVALLLAAGRGPALGQDAAQALTVFAAADLGPPFKQLVPQFERKTRSKITLVLGSTGTLAQQIRNGAPADVFFAANESYIQDLSAETLTILQTRTIYARGFLSTVTSKFGGIRINDLKELADPRVKRIAIANPTHAPYGLAARQALEAAGIWEMVQPKLVYGENVQQAAQFVRSGAADAGIVARSVADPDAFNSKLVDQKLYTPMNQMAVVLTRSKQPVLGMSFIEFVSGIQGRFVMRQFGFRLLSESP